MTLEYNLSREPATSFDTDCVVVGVFGDNSLTPSAAAIDTASGGRLSALLERGDVSGKTGKVTLLHDLDGVKAARVLVVGLGDQDKFGVPQYIKSVNDAARFLKSRPAERAYFTISETQVKDRDNAWNIRQSIVNCDHSNYRYNATLGAKAREKQAAEPALKKWTTLGDNEAALAQGIAIANGVNFARELGNLPPNICNPGYLAQQATKFASRFDNTSCEVLEESDMEELGMGSLLAVGRGSANPSKLIVLSYKNGGDAKPYVLVGKGITFDTGGINLKVAGGVEEMKFDMCGAATVIGTFVSAVGMNLPINLNVVVPAVENMPDANSYRPSDVLTSMSGKTIEVGNTDAEGRLILCDALTYAQRFEPQALVDVATLTGACMVALGKYASGLMSKHDDLANELLDAGEVVFDRAWRLPLWDEYQSMLDSTYADVYNIGGRWAGAVTAGCFLARFTEGQRWAHLDIAGSASDEGKRGMATGRPVGLLSQWLMKQANVA